MIGSSQQTGLGSLVQDLIDNTTLLFRQEVALLKAEVSQKAKTAASSAVGVVVGAVVAYTGVLALIAAAILGLATVWPAWLAALVIGLVIAGTGGIVLMLGIRHMQAVTAAPERTVRSVESTLQMLKEKA